MKEWPTSDRSYTVAPLSDSAIDSNMKSRLAIDGIVSNLLWFEQNQTLSDEEFQFISDHLLELHIQMLYRRADALNTQRASRRLESALSDRTDSDESDKTANMFPVSV